MATRPPRLRRPRTYFHVTTRGTNKWNIFLDEVDRLRFIHLLAAVCKRYGLETHTYCLMGNHLHLVVYCREPILSDAMRDLKSRYARYFNKRHKGTGPVFEAPFVEVPILDDDHFMTEIRYVHRNPLDLDPSACLAQQPWSSHGIYLGLRPQPHFLVTHVAKKLFGPDYRLIIETPQPHDKVQNTVPGPIVTSPGVVTIGAGYAVSSDDSLAGIRREVAAAAGCELAEVRTRSHNGLSGLAAAIALDLAGFSAVEIAEPYGYASSNAAQMAAMRARRRIVDDSELRRIHQIVVNRLRRAG